MYKIELIYIIFALILGALCLIPKKSPITAGVIILSFILIFVCSKVGSDYPNYKALYGLIETGTPYMDIHGDFLFNWLMYVFVSLKLNYDVFRVVYLSVCLIIFCVALYKMTNNFTFSFLIMYLGYIVYMISAYRQFGGMACILVSLYLYAKKKKILSPIIWGVIGTLLHKITVVYLAFIALVIIFNIIKRKESCLENSLNKFIVKFGYIILLSAIILRVMIYFAGTYNIFGVQKVFEMLMGGYSGMTLLSVGIVARIVTAGIMLFVASKIKFNKLTSILFLFFILNMFGAVLIPMETFVGRLGNNGRFLEIILIPLFAKELIFKRPFVLRPVLQYEKTYSYIYIILMVGIYASMFVFQMLLQGGYTPFDHMFF